MIIPGNVPERIKVPQGKDELHVCKKQRVKARVRPKGSGVGWRGRHGLNKEFGLRTEEPREGT